MNDYTPDVLYTLTASVDGHQVFEYDSYAIDMIEEELIYAERAVNKEVQENIELNNYAKEDHDED